MNSWLTAAGSEALVLFWWPVALWTVAAGVIVVVLRLLPERYAREQYELRTALLAALPIGLILGAVFRAVSAEPLIVVQLPYEIVVRAGGTASHEVIDLSTIAGVSTASLLLIAGAAAVALFGAVSLAADIRALGRFYGELTDVTDPESLALLSDATQEHGVSSSVRLVSSPTMHSPAAFGWLRPAVMIPERLLSHPDELRLVLLHETAHLARGDFALDTLARVVRTLFGWHPLVAYVFRTHAFWREAACDLAVITAPSVDRSAYARLLLDVSTRGNEPKPALVASMTASSSQLTKRIEAMIRIKNPDLTLPAVRKAVVFAVLAGVVTFTACSDSTPAAVEPVADAADVTTDKTGSDQVYATAEHMPELVGGLNAIAQSIVYPENAKKEGVQGRVVVQFIVEKDGTVSNVEVVRGVEARLDAEAVRAVESIEFTPGRKNGEPIRVQMSLPISFKLD